MGAGEGVTVRYSEGAACGTGTNNAVLHILCTTTAGEPVVNWGKMSSDGCTVEVAIKASAGCPTIVPYEGSDAVAEIAILLILIIGILLYLAVFITYNVKWKGATTKEEIIPHYAFWTSIPGLVKDGVLFIIHGFKKGDYTSV